MKITKLVFFALLFILITKSVSAQTFTPVEYRISEKPSHNDGGYKLRSGTNKTINFISSASNGYGTWAVDDQSNWYLLADTLVNEEAASGPYVAQPSGIVEQDTLGSGFQSGAVKVVTNLKGEVWFVGASPTGKFTVKGFRDFRDTSINPMYKHLDIKFQGIPKPVATRRILKNPLMIRYDERMDLPSNPGFNKYVAAENDWRDGFDVCCDQKFMYIVWEYQNDPIIGQPTPVYDLYLTVFRLSDGSIYDSTVYPKRLVVNGRRPTISCDPRNNPTAPDCDIAFIDFLPPYPQAPIDVKNAKICYSHVQGTSTPIKPFNQDFLKGPGSSDTYQYATHVRMLTGSTLYQRSYPCKAIYALVNNYGGRHVEDTKNEFLIMYRFSSLSHETATPLPQAVDGARELFSHRMPPVAAVDDTMKHNVLNTHLIGFANPYDGDTASGKYDEFHCIYAPKQYTPLNNTNPHFETIVRGVNNGVFNDVFGDTSNDTRTIINREKNSSGLFQFLPRPGHSFDKVGVIGGVNQMGIHLYWKDIDEPTTYYSRDQRRFDEPIEENTLLTHYCEIGDGRSHKGTLGAQLLPNRELTFWTDPNFDVHNVSGEQSFGIYTAANTPKFTLGYHNAKLAFVDSATSLEIGDGDTRSILTMLPNFEVRFDPNPNSIKSHQININGNSLWQYYGIPYSSVGFTPIEYNFYGRGNINLFGYAATLSEGWFGYPTSLTKPATLVIHGGAEMRIPPNVYFRAENSYIFMKNERSIEPVYSIASPDTNQWKTGSLTSSGYLTLYKSIISGEGTSLTNFANIIRVKPVLAIGLDPDRLCFYSFNSLFTNSYKSGYSRVLFQVTNGASVPATDFNGRVIFQSGKMRRAQIYAEDPLVEFSVGGVEFDSVKVAGIHLKRKTSLDYHDILLSYNKFLTYSLDSSRGILIENFDKDHEDSSGNVRISISNNRFTTQTAGSPFGHKAIHLVNSSAGIVQNVISSNEHRYGIVVERDSSLIALDRSTAFMCSDSISNVGGAAIKTNNWEGYIKLCKLFNSNIGYFSGDKDRGGLVFSNIHDCDGPGIALFAPSSGSSLLDISGVHSTAPAEENDYAGFDTLKFNNNISGYPKGQIELYANTTLKMGSTSGFSNYGFNLLVRNDSTDNFIYKSGTPTISIGNADSNYWKNGDGTKHTPSTSGTNPFENVTYTSALPTDNVVGLLGDVLCSSGYSFNTKKSGQKPMSITESTECQDLLNRGRALVVGGGYQYAYDTIRHYIEVCANEYQSWFAFSDITGANGHRKEDNIRYTEYREWLKNVLYLNTKDSAYYCYDVNEIFSTFNWFNDVRGRDYNGSIAVAQYLIESNRCPELTEQLKIGLEATKKKVIEIYLDTVKDSLATPIDTTIPTLAELDLDILRGKTGVVSGGAVSINVPRLSDVTAERNPFTDEVALKVELTTSTMVRLDIYDELGRSVYGEGLGYKQKGDHKFSVDGKTWAHGVYYARISTSGGEIRTLKLIKQ